MTLDFKIILITFCEKKFWKCFFRNRKWYRHRRHQADQATIRRRFCALQAQPLTRPIPLASSHFFLRLKWLCKILASLGLRVGPGSSGGAELTLFGLWRQRLLRSLQLLFLCWPSYLTDLLCIVNLWGCVDLRFDFWKGSCLGKEELWTATVKMSCVLR